jgi:hypothetical protein
MGVPSGLGVVPAKPAGEKERSKTSERILGNGFMVAKLSFHIVGRIDFFIDSLFDFL